MALRRQKERLPTCTIDHTGGPDAAELCLHSCDPPHPEIVCPHADAGHRAVLDDLGARGAAFQAASALRGLTAHPLAAPAQPGRDPCFCSGRLRVAPSGTWGWPQGGNELRAPGLGELVPLNRDFKEKKESSSD